MHCSKVQDRKLSQQKVLSRVRSLRSMGTQSATQRTCRVTGHLRKGSARLSAALQHRRMLDGMRLAWRILHQPQVATRWLGPIVGDTGPVLDQAAVASDSALMDFIRNNCNTLFHPVGTMKMGPPDDPMAVVDQYCCVR